MQVAARGERYQAVPAPPPHSRRHSAKRHVPETDTPTTAPTPCSSVRSYSQQNSYSAQHSKLLQARVVRHRMPAGSRRSQSAQDVFIAEREALPDAPQSALPRLYSAVKFGGTVTPSSRAARQSLHTSGSVMSRCSSSSQQREDLSQRTAWGKGGVTDKELQRRALIERQAEYARALAQAALSQVHSRKQTVTEQHKVQPAAVHAAAVPLPLLPQLPVPLKRAVSPVRDRHTTARADFHVDQSNMSEEQRLAASIARLDDLLRTGMRNAAQQQQQPVEHAPQQASQASRPVLPQQQLSLLKHRDRPSRRDRRSVPPVEHRHQGVVFSTSDAHLALLWTPFF